MLKHFYHEKTLKLANLIIVIIAAWFLLVLISGLCGFSDL